MTTSHDVSASCDHPHLTWSDDGAANPAMHYRCTACNKTIVISYGTIIRGDTDTILHILVLAFGRQWRTHTIEPEPVR